MKTVDLLNKLQVICHNGHSLDEIKLVINNQEISLCDVRIYAENNEIKLSVNHK